jgi:hypothetical protein
MASVWGGTGLRFSGLFIVPFILGIALATGAEAKGPVTIHVKAIKGRIEFSYRGKKLTDSKLDQLCAASRRQKAEIEFQKERMNSNDTMASLLREAQCLSATHASGFMEIDRRSEPKPVTHTRAKQRRKAAAPR